jgi:serine/threonine-protein kinase
MTHDVEHWDALQSLFHLGEETPEAELDKVLEGACGDPALRERARALILGSREGIDKGVELPSPPEKIGPYRIIRKVGSGGIGTVYLVERMVGGVVQRAALKVLSLHAAGPAFAERFAREQNILASLDHPNITRMLDAGVGEGGQPYLLMEYVDGEQLDQFCDERRLGIIPRLKLFLEACEAVSHAHRNLVVHLDLKPSNILVTQGEGAIKLLDFGTSKLIQPDSLLTATVMATPAYASPEHLRNEAVTTACDVYSLGVILFELLSGRRPDQDSSVAIRIERALREQPPELVTEAITVGAAELRGVSQARLLSLIRGDLATIVAKCLSPRPQDRYLSVELLIADVQRYLAGRPILARPQTTAYRLAKFVRRNRKAVLAGVVTASALLLTAGYAVWQQEQAFRAGQRALQMQSFMTQLFKFANPNYTGKPAATVPELLQLGVRVLPDFIPDAADRRHAQLSLAESMVGGGDYNNAASNLVAVIADAKATKDLPVEAEAEAELGGVDSILGKIGVAQQLTASALALDHRRGVTPLTRVLIESAYANVREDNGFKSDETLRLYQDAVAESRANHIPEHELASQINRLGMSLGIRGRLPEAAALLHESLAIYQREPYATCDEGVVYAYLGGLQRERGDYTAALPMFQQAYDRVRRCSGDNSIKTLGAQAYLAQAMMRTGDPKAGISMLEAALPNWRAVTGPNSPDYSVPLMFLTRGYLDSGQFDKAEPYAREALHALNGKFMARSAIVGYCEDALAQALAGQHRYAEALPHAQAAVDDFQGTLNPAEKTAYEKAKASLASIQAHLSQESAK